MSSRKAEVHPLLPPGEADLVPSTPVYKYLSGEAFLHLLRFRSLTFSRVCSWPDAYEGTRYDFLQRVRKGPNLSRRFFGSCWSLEQHERAAGESQNAYAKANEEMCRDGSAAMWAAFCVNGGVRIQSTIEKVDAALCQDSSGHDMFRGRVFYEASSLWNQTMQGQRDEYALLAKGISFRHEAEYRFLLRPQQDPPDDVVHVSVPDDLFAFIDEVLVGPMPPSRAWVARAIYSTAVGLSVSLGSTNHKNGRPFCRISQLFGTISERNCGPP